MKLIAGSTVVLFTVTVSLSRSFQWNASPSELLEGRVHTERLWELPAIGGSLDVLVPDGAVDIGGRVLYPKPPSGRLPGYGGGSQFLSDVIGSTAPEQDARRVPLRRRGAHSIDMGADSMHWRRSLERRRGVQAADGAHTHWVGMAKDSHGRVHYVDASGREYAKGGDRFGERWTPMPAKKAASELNLALFRKVYEKARKFVKQPDKPVLQMKHGMRHGESPKSHEGLAPPVSLTKTSTGEYVGELQKVAGSLRKISVVTGTKSLDSDSQLAKAAKVLADVSSHLGDDIMADNGVMKKEDSQSPALASKGRLGEHGLDRELRIEMDLHSRLFGRNGLCTSGMLQRSTICRKLQVDCLPMLRNKSQTHFTQSR